MTPSRSYRALDFRVDLDASVLRLSRTGVGVVVPPAVAQLAAVLVRAYPWPTSTAAIGAEMWGANWRGDVSTGVWVRVHHLRRALAGLGSVVDVVGYERQTGYLLVVRQAAVVDATASGLAPERLSKAASGLAPERSNDNAQPDLEEAV